MACVGYESVSPAHFLLQLKALILNDTSLGDDGVAAVCQALTQPGAAPQLEVRRGPVSAAQPSEVGREGAASLSCCPYISLTNHLACAMITSWCRRRY